MNPGDRIASFRIVSSLGAAGLGDVYRAHDQRLHDDVALRVLQCSESSDDERRETLLRDARAAAALEHPHICRIHEIGEVGDLAYIAMELVEGQSLDSLLPAGGFNEPDLLSCGVQVADAMAHAHEHGILHRGLQPRNIIITGAGYVKVFDFGLANVTIEATGQTRGTGGVNATLAYLSPEQVRGEAANTASDVWSLGVVLHEMASGTRPFEGSTNSAMAAAILKQSPRQLPNMLPAVLRGIITRCLAKDPRKRYQQAGELRDSLNRILVRHSAGPLPIAVADQGKCSAKSPFTGECRNQGRSSDYSVERNQARWGKMT